MANDMVSYWCKRVFDNFKNSVICFNNDAGAFSGNGFVVFSNDKAWLILTCEHILPKSNGNVVMGSTVSALFHTGVRFKARVAYVDAGGDLALLSADRIIDVPCTPLRFWEDGDVVSGIDVVLLSFFTMKYGQVLAEPGTFPGKILSEPVWSEETMSGEFCSDYTSMNGTSGAPVFLQRVNKVVGVNSGALGTTKTAISVRTIQATLREWLQAGDVKVQQKFKDYTCASACTLNHFLLGKHSSWGNAKYDCWTMKYQGHYYLQLEQGIDGQEELIGLRDKLC